MDVENMELFERLEKTGLIPVIKITDPEKAVPLAKALRDGGLNAAEITFRTSCAAEAIARIRKEYPDMLIGAGTVLTPEQADDAWEAGADFIVSPGLNPDVVAHCNNNNYPIVPGCATPSEIELALSMGLTYVKFFPAEAAGGLPMIKAMSAPYKGVRFMPTGGINENNLNAYLACPAIFCCGGSFMVSDKLIDAGKFEEITKLTAMAVNKMLGFEMHHIGVNATCDEEAKSNASMLQTMFGFANYELPVSYFEGPFEIMKEVGRGKNGHIGISVNNVARAAYHLENKGIAMDYTSAMYDEKGDMRFIYIRDEMLGFAIHLTRK